MHILTKLKKELQKIQAAPSKKFTVDNQEFFLQDRGDGNLQITSIHPYDETEYHWAIGKDKTWNIYRKGKREFGTNCMDYKKVAKKCLELDKAKKLGRTGGIW